MESLSKILLDRNTLDNIISAAFGPEREILTAEENREGWFNALYALNLKGGDPVFLKAAPPEDVPVLDYERDIMGTEIALLKVFEENDAIPSPRILFEDRTRRIIGTDYFIMEKLRGSSLSRIRESLDGKDLKRLDRDKGRINREINRYVNDSFGIYGDRREKYATWKEAFLTLTDAILNDADKFRAPFPVPLSEIASLFRSRSSCLDWVTEPQLLHWDLHDGNILIGEEREITGIIDCDRALWGDPAMENYFSRLFPQDDAFFEGYGPEVVNSPGFTERRGLYDLYLTVIFVTECRSRNIRDRNHLDWAEKMFRDQWEWLRKKR